MHHEPYASNTSPACWETLRAACTLQPLGASWRRHIAHPISAWDSCQMGNGAGGKWEMGDSERSQKFKDPFILLWSVFLLKGFKKERIWQVEICWREALIAAKLKAGGQREGESQWWRGNGPTAKLKLLMVPQDLQTVWSKDSLTAKSQALNMQILDLWHTRLHQPRRGHLDHMNASSQTAEKKFIFSFFFFFFCSSCESPVEEIHRTSMLILAKAHTVTLF